MSKKAEEQALKQIAQKKAAKEAKALRQMVIVQPRNFTNGSIVKNGKIYDIAGNTVAKVNTKNGKIMLLGQAWAGRWVNTSRNPMMTNALIQEAINKYSPYYINLRKMQAMQQGTVWGAAGTQEVINIYGRSAGQP